MSIHIDGAVVQREESFKFVGVRITKELTWSTHSHTGCEEGMTAPLPPQEAEQIWHGPSDLQNIVYILKMFYLYLTRQVSLRTNSYLQ